MATQKPQAKPVVRSATAKPAVKKATPRPTGKTAASVKPKTTARAPAKTTAPALKKTLVPITKSAAKPPVKLAAKPVSKPVAKAVVKSEKKADPKVKKIKQVRDSFTMPETEYEVLSQVKKACLKAGFEIKKSDLLRIGVSLIKNLDTVKLKTLLSGLTPLKVGRPKK